MEALAENYRVELSGFGVDSCIVEPGGYPTGFHNNVMEPSDSSRNSSYGDFVQAPMESFTNSQKALEANQEQNPQNVADAVSDLIDTPAGQRTFRTVVDSMGMSDHIKGYNEQLAQINSVAYNAFGMGEMLKLKVRQ